MIKRNLLFFITAVLLFTGCGQINSDTNSISDKEVTTIEIQEAERIEESEILENITESEEDSYKVDIESYYEDNSVIISKYEISNATNILTASEAISFFCDRGFDDYPVVYEYNMNGDLVDIIECESGSEIKSPIYNTYYLDKKDRLWTIQLIGDSITAYPSSIIFSMMQSGEPYTPIFIAEKESIIGYGDRMYYEVIPYDNVIDVYVSEVIPETLDTFEP